MERLVVPFASCLCTSVSVGTQSSVPIFSLSGPTEYSGKWIKLRQDRSPDGNANQGLLKDVIIHSKFDVELNGLLIDGPPNTNL